MSRAAATCRYCAAPMIDTRPLRCDLCWKGIAARMKEEAYKAGYKAGYDDRAAEETVGAGEIR